MITTTSVFVDDQQKALDFSPTTLGFQLTTDVPAGPFRWLTVVPPSATDGLELLPEPSQHPAVGPFEEAPVTDGIPFNSFGVDDVQAEHERSKGLGVRFVQESAQMGPVTTAVLDDTGGTLIQIAAVAAAEPGATAWPPGAGSAGDRHPSGLLSGTASFLPARVGAVCLRPVGGRGATVTS